MKNQKGNTSTTLLILILVIIVGFVVWYATAHKADIEPQGVQINLGGDSSQQ